MWSFLKRIFACKCTKEQIEDEANIVEYKDVSIYESMQNRYNIHTKRRSKCEDGFREIFGLNSNHKKSG